MIGRNFFIIYIVVSVFKIFNNAPLSFFSDSVG